MDCCHNQLYFFKGPDIFRLISTWVLVLYTHKKNVFPLFCSTELSRIAFSALLKSVISWFEILNHITHLDAERHPFTNFCQMVSSVNGAVIQVWFRVAHMSFFFSMFHHFVLDELRCLSFLSDLLWVYQWQKNVLMGCHHISSSD